MPEIRIGIFTDLHYCDCDDDLEYNRYHRNSLNKLKQIVHYFNEQAPDFVVNLGDTIDRNSESFKPVTEILATLNPRLINLTGNHDFDVKPDERQAIADHLGINERYHYFDIGSFRLFFLEGSEISIFANVEDSENYREAQKKLKELSAQNEVNANEWNGGMSKKQVKWFKEKLLEAKNENLRAIAFCHYPIFPKEKHSLLNYQDILQIISDNNHLKGWLCGHNHAGNYGLFNQCHVINFKGVVDTPLENACCIVTVTANEIAVKGYGREIDRKLKI